MMTLGGFGDTASSQELTTTTANDIDRPLDPLSSGNSLDDNLDNGSRGQSEIMTLGGSYFIRCFFQTDLQITLFSFIATEIDELFQASMFPDYGEPLKVIKDIQHSERLQYSSDGGLVMIQRKKGDQEKHKSCLPALEVWSSPMLSRNVLK